MPLIEEIASCDFDDDPAAEDGDGQHEHTTAAVAASVVVAVNAALDDLVEHYRQRIHLVGVLGGGGDDDESVVNRSELPAVVQSLVQRVVVKTTRSSSGNHDDEESSLLLMMEALLLVGYASKIRPALFAETASSNAALQDCGIAVVVHYERFVSALLSAATAKRTDKESSRGPPSSNNIQQQRRVEQALKQLVRDVTAVQSQENQKRNRVVLPALLRLMHHVFGFIETTMHQHTYLDPGVLRSCRTALLALEAPTSPVEMDPARIKQRLLDLSLYMDLPHEEATTGTNNNIMDNIATAADYGMPETVLKIVGLGSTSDDDDVSGKIDGKSSLSVEARRIADLIVSRWSEATDAGSENTHIHPTNASAATGTDRQRKRHLLKQLNWLEMAKTVRAHFFGRGTGGDKAVTMESRLHLGHAVTRQKFTSSFVTPPHQFNPSRRNAALAYIQLLDTVDESLWEELLPVIYELLGSSQDRNVQWGAVCLFRLLSCGDNDDGGRWCLPPPLATDNLLSMLSNAVRICRVGGTLALLGLAQRHLLVRLFERETSSSNGNRGQNYEQLVLRRRQVTQQWLSLLDRHNRHVTKDYLVWGLLMGGVAPLLYDHAHAGENADAVELGRLGLSALLPVLRGECGFCDLRYESIDENDDIYTAQQDIFAGCTSDDENEDTATLKSNRMAIAVAVQVAALAALSNLLVAAHPIMSRHAGKLLCSCLAYVRRHSDHNKIQPLALDVALRVFVVAGDPASAILKRIVSSNELDSQMLELVGDIENHAVKYRAY